jgi:hypothetical protein
VAYERVKPTYIRKKCLTSEVPSPLDIYTGFKGHSRTVQSLTYPTEKLVETVGTAVTVLENVISVVGGRALMLTLVQCWAVNL